MLNCSRSARRRKVDFILYLNDATTAPSPLEPHYLRLPLSPRVPKCRRCSVSDRRSWSTVVLISVTAVAAGLPCQEVFLSIAPTFSVLWRHAPVYDGYDAPRSVPSSRALLPRNLKPRPGPNTPRWRFHSNHKVCSNTIPVIALSFITL